MPKSPVVRSNLRHRNQTQPIQTQKFQAFTSPLPPPEELLKYEEVQAGLINKIIEMTELQGLHRRTSEMKSLEAQINNSNESDKDRKRGQWFAFIIALVAIISGTSLVFIGHDFAGGSITFIGVGLITLAEKFIQGRGAANTIPTVSN